MKPRKSIKARLKEGRGSGIGPDYTPLIKVEEARSTGTATRLYDAQQGRSVHTLSRTELSFYLTSKYYFMKAGNPILYVREQYPLNMDDVNRIRRHMGLPHCPPSDDYSTDFLFDLHNGQQRAYSLKSSYEEFDRSTKRGKVQVETSEKLQIRQEIERRYWTERGVPFAIVTGDTLNTTLASNLRTLHFHSDERFVVTTEQKALWLASHGFIEIKDIETNRINGVKLLKSLDFNVDAYYDHIIERKAELLHEKQHKR